MLITGKGQSHLFKWTKWMYTGHVWLLNLDTAGRLGCVSKRGHSQHRDKDLGSQKSISFLWHLKRRCWLNFWNVTPNWQRGPLWLNDPWSLYFQGCKHPSSWKKKKKTQRKHLWQRDNVRGPRMIAFCFYLCFTEQSTQCFGIGVVYVVALLGPYCLSFV